MHCVPLSILSRGTANRMWRDGAALLAGSGSSGIYETSPSGHISSLIGRVNARIKRADGRAAGIRERAWAAGAERGSSAARGVANPLHFGYTDRAAYPSTFYCRARRHTLNVLDFLLGVSRWKLAGSAGLGQGDILPLMHFTLKRPIRERHGSFHPHPYLKHVH